MSETRMKENTAKFSISEVGKVTGEKWIGDFVVKKHLSLRDFLTRDKLRKEYLGDKPEDSNFDAVNIAVAFSELGVRIIDAPPWWAASNGGLELLDGNVVMAILTQAMKIEEDAIKVVKKEGEAAVEVVKENPINF